MRGIFNSGGGVKRHAAASNSPNPTLFQFSVAIVSWVLLVFSQVDGVAAEVTVGVAKEELRLPRFVPLAGYSRRRGAPSTGVHDPVSVRALVIRDGHTSIALISGDLLIIDEHLFETVRQRAIARGLPSDLVLLLAATHTHSGPGAYGTAFLEKISMGHFNPRMFEEIANRATQAIVRADSTAIPARVAYRAVTLGELVTNRVIPGGEVDSELIVTAFYSLDKNVPFVILVNFSAHPTTLGSWNTLVSADYPGVVIRELERRFPTATCLFFAGSVGDQAPAKIGIGFERAERIGLALAQRAASLLEDTPPEPVNSLSALQERMPLPPAHVRLGHFSLPRWLGRQLVDNDATLSVVAVGKALFVGVPCDLQAGLGARLKHAAREFDKQPIIIGFASDYIGYCVSEALYQSKRYESSMAFNGPLAGELITERLAHMIEKLAANNQQQATSHPSGGEEK